jgi:putative DNA primase/helicase
MDGVRIIEAKHVRKFFEDHLGHSLPHRDQVSLHCPFHDDKTASLSVNLADGVWNCQAGCGKGGIIDFEVAVSKCDHEAAKANIAGIVGVDLFGTGNQKPEAIYQYRDANGTVVFEKLRLPGKHFTQRRPVGKGYARDLNGITKPLYNLPELVTANVAIICEGEKDCDNVTRAMGEIGDDIKKGARITTTTNFDGAGKWQDHYNPYFAGRKVVIIPDNDQPGTKHADLVARSVHPYAVGVKIANLPGLAEKGDVSDYLQTHSPQDLLAEIAKATSWYPPKVEHNLFIAAPQFLATVPDEIDWLVEHVIQRGSNGMISAIPKAGKSWASVDLGIAIALGEPWLGFRVPRPGKVALISREDNPALTQWRMKNLWRGRSASNPKLIETNLVINTRMQSPQLLLDDEAQLTELMEKLRTFKPEFAIFDVFNVLHTADENDNSEMREVLRQLSRVQTEIGCGICVVHHYNKAELGTLTLTQKLRGASSIAGWCEWVMGISMHDEATKTRRVQFELKAAEPPEPVLFRIVSNDETTTLEVQNEATGAVRKPAHGDYVLPLAVG